jgi:hypothetical protein
MTDHDGSAAVTAVGTAPTSLKEAQRRRRGVQAALDLLERAIAAPSTGREQEWVSLAADRLVQLQAAWSNHVCVTEEPDGLFDEVIAEAPRLSHQVNFLRADHVRIAALIEGALQLATRPAAEGFISDISESSVDLLARLTRHRHLGATLVYEAYHVDMDAAD